MKRGGRGERPLSEMVGWCAGSRQTGRFGLRGLLGAGFWEENGGQKSAAAANG